MRFRSQCVHLAARGLGHPAHITIRISGKCVKTWLGNVGSLFPDCSGPFCLQRTGPLPHQLPPKKKLFAPQGLLGFIFGSRYFVDRYCVVVDQTFRENLPAI